MNIDLDFVRSMIKRGAVKICTSEKPPMSESVVIFDDISPEIIRDRRNKSQSNEIHGEWFLVTDRPRGLEWKDDVAVIGLFVIEVEDLSIIRQELMSFS